MRPLFRFGALATVLCSLGCASQPHPEIAHFDSSKPIDRSRGLRQDGSLVRADEVEKALLLEPEAGPYLRRSKTWSMVSLISATAGGALIGWPVGEALGKNPDPLWELAAVGGGFVVLSFALIPLTVSNYNSAIDAHNELVRPNQVSLMNGNLRLEANVQGLAIRF
jgi:hypothetical protein